MNKPKFETPDMVEKNIEKLAEIFPNCITEARDENGKLKKAVNFEMLQQILSTQFPPEGSPERYEFTWVGKRAAIAEANKPIRKTLRPCKAESKNWDITENLYIEGDNLEVLKLLQESYLGKVKMIYIDPPYNKGNDYIYNDNFKQIQQEYDEEAGLFDEDENRLFKNTETNGRFHSDWCSMMYSRLMLAKNFLSDDGVIFISIDDDEITNLKKITDEIFGEKNFVDCITWNTRVPKNDNKGLGNIHQYIIVYNKSQKFNRKFMMGKEGIEEVFDFIKILKRKNLTIPDAEKELKNFYNKKGYDRGITLYNSLDNLYRPWGKINMSWPNSDSFGPDYDILHPITKKPVKKPDRGWRWNRETLKTHLGNNSLIKVHDGSWVCGDIWFGKDESVQPSSIKYLNDVSKLLLRTIISLKSDGGVELEKIFDRKSFFSNPKPVSLIKILINAIEENDYIIMDFFSGSATTAHAVMQLNAEDGGHRKFIMVQLPEVCDEKSEAYKAGYKNICEIGKERIRRAGEKIKADNPLTTQDLDIGFRVFKVDSSNMNDVYYSAGEYSQDMLVNLEDNIKPDRTDLDLLFGCLLDWGLPISLPYTSEQIENCTVHTYNEGDLVACFDENISEGVIKEIAKRKPLRAVFRDAGFGSSPEKINVTEIFKMLAPDTDVKVI